MCIFVIAAVTLQQNLGALAVMRGEACRLPDQLAAR